MKRYTGMRVLTQALLDSDIGIFIGKDLCKEAHPYRQHESNLYFPDTKEGLLSVALGMAMCTDKRIFVFCEDHYAIRNMSELMHIGVSRCKNIFVVLFVSNFYPAVENAPNIFGSINNQHGVLYNMSLLVHDYANFFKESRNPINTIRHYWERSKGPLVALMKTTKGSKQMPDMGLSSKEDLERTKEFILDESIIAHNFVAPFSLDEINLEG
jgi:hypothetical protein